MASLRIMGVQMAVGRTKGENLPKILDYITKTDADFIVFPEMALTGYNADFSDARTLEAWDKIAAACRHSYATAIVGTGSRADGKVYIQSRIFGDDGEVLGTHEKIVPTEKDRAWCTPGSKLKTFNHKGITFGCLISNDFWVAPGTGPYPDNRLSYQLGQQGAEVIFLSMRTGFDPEYAQYYEANLRLRAKESGCYVVTANAAADNGPLAAPTGILAPNGTWIVKCPLDGEQTFVHDLDLDAG